MLKTLQAGLLAVLQEVKERVISAQELSAAIEAALNAGDPEQDGLSFLDHLIEVFKEHMAAAQQQRAARKSALVAEIAHRVGVAVPHHLQVVEADVNVEEQKRATLNSHPSIADSAITLRPHLPIEQAFATVVRIAEMPVDAFRLQARRRISDAYHLSTRCNVQKLVAEVLPDLDDLLFRGELGGKVPVLWRPFEPPLMGKTVGGRVCDAGGERHVTVMLAESLMLEHKAVLWGTVIHELLHAYAIVVSLDHLEQCCCGWAMEHGPGFAVAVEGLVGLLGVEELGVQDVEVYEGRCHSCVDETRIRKEVARREEEVMGEELEGVVLGWWGKDGE